MIPVTLITHDATLDDLSAADYADIWQELRQNHSLRNVIGVMQSELSPALWNQFEKGEKALTRQMRNDLRRAVDLPLLPPTVAEATAQASPDAAVWYVSEVGDKPADTVIMVAAEHELWLHVNGSVTVAQPEAQIAHVTPVTRPAIARKRYIRPCIPESYSERLQRLGDGFTWQDVIDAGLRVYEQMP